MKAKLLKEHEHAGKLLPVGSIIELDLDQYNWLVDLKVVTCDIADAVVGASVTQEVTLVPAKETSDYVAPQKKSFWGKASIASDAPSEPTEAQGN